MIKTLNSEQIKSLQFGLYYCSACAKSFERSELRKVDSCFDIYLNCPCCSQNIDIEYHDDEP